MKEVEEKGPIVMESNHDCSSNEQRQNRTYNNNNNNNNNNSNSVNNDNNNSNSNSSSLQAPLDTSGAPLTRPCTLPVQATTSPVVSSVIGEVPALREQMESLHALQSRQKELDEWYGTMQKQLDLEKMRYDNIFVFILVFSLLKFRWKIYVVFISVLFF